MYKKQIVFLICHRWPGCDTVISIKFHVVVTVLTFPPLQLSCEGGRLWADETHRLSRKWTINLFANKSGWYLGLHATRVSDSMP